MQEFRLTEDHLKLLKAAEINWHNAEYGAPGIDCKRPYGNSDVTGDVAEILGWTLAEYRSDEWEEQYVEAAEIHRGLLEALQILVCFADQGVKPGLYRRDRRNPKVWEHVEENL